MALLGIPFLLCSFILITASAAVDLPLPACAVTCIADLLPASGCGFADTQCICRSQYLLSNVPICLDANCTVIESLETLRYQKTTCDAPIRDQSALTRRISWSLLGIALFFVVARVISRLQVLKGSGYCWDDLTILLTAMLAVPLAAILDIMTHLGLGRDIWTIDPVDITRVVYYLWVEEYLYITIVSLTKISILFLFLRMWPESSGAESHWFRLACLTLIIAVSANNLAFFIALSVQCTPISHTWTRWTGQTIGHCIDLNAFVYAVAGINIVFDLSVALLPFRRLLKLEISFRRKIAVCATFSVGLFVTACSIVRLRYLKQFSDTENPTWNYNKIAIWSSVECNLGIVCACMPSMAGLLQRIWSHSLGTTSPSYPLSTSRVGHTMNRSLDRTYCRPDWLQDGDEEAFAGWNHSAPLTEEELNGSMGGGNRVTTSTERNLQLYQMKAFADG